MTDHPQPEKPPIKQDAVKPENADKNAPVSRESSPDAKATVPNKLPTTDDLSSKSPDKPPASSAPTTPTGAKPATPSAPPPTAPTGAKPPVPVAPTQPTTKDLGNPPPKPTSAAPSIPQPIAPRPQQSSTRDLRDFSKDATIPSKGTLVDREIHDKKEDTQLPGVGGQPKVAQRFNESTSEVASQSAMQICPTCGHRNRPGVLICDNCGTNLMTGSKTAVGTRDLVREQEERKKDPTKEKLLDTSEVKAVETAGATTFREDMVLRIEIEGGTTPMMVYPKNEIIMGRRDPNTGGMPDVDLTSYAGYRMGVSRRHAAIRLQDSQLNVSDLGSSNGTFLNGTRLNAHRPYQVRDGDEIRLGQMVLHVYFQTGKDKK